MKKKLEIEDLKHSISLPSEDTSNIKGGQEIDIIGIDEIDINDSNSEDNIIVEDLSII